MPRRSLKRLYLDEFTGYNLAKFRQDLLAGLTVAAVALPLALAFGVASGAAAAAGLVTAVVAGLDRRFALRHASAADRYFTARPSHRLYPSACHHRLYFWDRADHLYRPDRQFSRGEDRTNHDRSF